MLASPITPCYAQQSSRISPPTPFHSGRRLFQVPHMSQDPASDDHISYLSPPHTPSARLGSDAVRETPTTAPVSRPSSRTVKPNPLLKNSDDRRRDRAREYLNGVRSRRAEWLGRSRCDVLEQRDFLEEQRAWEERLCGDAPRPIIEEDEMQDACDDWPGSFSAPRSSRDVLASSQTGRLHHQPYHNSFSAFSSSSARTEDGYMSFARSSQPSLSYSQSQPFAGPDTPFSSRQDTKVDDAAEVDAVLQAEEQELEALVAVHEAPPDPLARNEAREDSDYGSEWDEEIERELAGLGDAMDVDGPGG